MTGATLACANIPAAARLFALPGAGAGRLPAEARGRAKGEGFELAQLNSKERWRVKGRLDPPHSAESRRQ